MVISRLLCLIGFHDWGLWVRYHSIENDSEYVWMTLDDEQGIPEAMARRCNRCGKVAEFTTVGVANDA